MNVGGERVGQVAAGPSSPTAPLTVAPAVPPPGSPSGTERPVDPDELEGVLARMHARPDGDAERERLREHAILGYLPLARHAARRYRTARVPDGDLAQVAVVGLIKAIDRFDPDRGVPFLGFAMPTVVGELRHHVRDHGWGLRPPRSVQERVRRVHDVTDELAQRLGRVPRPSDVAEHLGLDADEVLDALAADQASRTLSLDVPLETAEPAVDPEHGAVEDRATVAGLLAGLAPQDRRIVELRFFAGFSQARIADEIGYSQMYVSRALARILRTLRRDATAA